MDVLPSDWIHRDLMLREIYGSGKLALINWSLYLCNPMTELLLHVSPDDLIRFSVLIVMYTKMNKA